MAAGVKEKGNKTEQEEDRFVVLGALLIASAACHRGVLLAKLLVAVLVCGAITVLGARFDLLCGAWPTSDLIDTLKFSGAIAAFFAGDGAAVFAFEGDAKAASAVVGALAAFLSDLFFPDIRATFIDLAIAIVIAAIVTTLCCAGMDGWIVVVAILFGGASEADAVAIAILIDTHAAAGAAFIDLTIAVVVEAIAADLGSFGQCLSFASSPHAIDALLFACLADADIGAVDRACEAILCLAAGAGSLHDTAFINLAIAVIVKAVVADLLGLGSQLTETSGPIAVDAKLRTCLTDADPFSVCGAAVTTSAQFFINLTVAVVVFAIADLIRGFDVVGAGSPLSICAALCSIFARADASGTAGTCITSAGLAACAFGRCAAAVVAIGVISGDPACDAIVSDIVPSGIAKDILTGGIAAIDFEASSFGNSADGGLVGVGLGADIKRGSAEADGFDVIADRRWRRWWRGGAAAFALCGGMAEISATADPIVMEEGIAVSVADVDLEVEVRACGAAAGTDLSEAVAALDLLTDADLDGSAFHVEVVGLFSVAVTEADVISAARRTAT